jgi:polyisoprenoid-binding protein YceI
MSRFTVALPRAALALCLALAAAPAAAQPANYEIDPDHLSLGFLVTHIGYAKVLGQFRTARGGKRTSDRTFEITGALELRGRSQPLTLQATLNKSAPSPLTKAHTMGVSATGTVKRSAYGMDYAVANGWVGDDVQLIIEFEAIRK